MNTASTDLGHLIRASALIHQLMPSDGSIDGLVEALSAYRGRRIEVIPAQVGPRPTAGFWVAGIDVDYLAHSGAASPIQRATVIGHELAHLLLRHTPSDQLGSHITGRGPTRLLTLHSYPAADEAAARRLGRRILRLSVNGRRRGHHRDAKVMLTARSSVVGVLAGPDRHGLLPGQVLRQQADHAPFRGVAEVPPQ